MKKIAIPLANGQLCMHFGHCQQFALVEADAKTGTIINRQDLIPPPHEPGVLPAWLAEQKVELVIAGGMGGRARQLFESAGIEVVVGATSGTPEELVAAYLAGGLVCGQNVCDH